MVPSFVGEEIIKGIKIPGNVLLITVSFEVKNMYELTYNLYLLIFPYTLMVMCVLA